MTFDRWGRRQTTFTDLPKPDALPPAMAALGDAIRTLQEWREERAKANLKARHLTDTLVQARNDDRLASARALREGKADPGPRLVTATTERIGQVKRQEEGWDLNVQEAQAAIRALCQQQGAAWGQALDATEADARRDIGTALAALSDAVGRLQEASALRYFLDAAADPQVFLVRARSIGLRVFGLTSANREPYTADTVLAALRPLAEPPVAAAPGEPHPLRARDSGEGIYVGGGGVG